MATLSEKPDPAAIEQEAQALWVGQRLPPPHGPVGPADGPVVHQFLGSFAPQEAGMLVVQRMVAADVDARAMILAGRRAQGILRMEEGGPPTSTPRLGPLLTALGVWVGGSDGRAWDSAPRHAEVQALVGRLAHLGALALRDVSLRICPACAMVRSPEQLVYQEEDGETLLVRFPFGDGERTVSALVWTDAPWRLLGTSALMVHPDLPYVVARYRRRGAEELVFTSKSSLDRLRGWLPGADIEIVEEHPGQHWVGRAYVHPLRHQFPMGGNMMPPAGTILSVADVSDSGTGVVPLVPGHGGTDTQIADRLSVPGWPLITPKGRFDILFVHKYAGLELESGSEFVARDLDEEGAIFARLRVRRGVPHCSRCGTALIWAPGRAWCLEPSRLPEEKVAVYRTLLPRDRPIEKLEAVPWPVSEPQRSEDPQAIALLECTSCDRLEAPGKDAGRCACGGRRRTVRRRLLSAFDAAAGSWASVDPFPTADAARLFVNERRRAPAVVHHIATMSGVGGTVGEVRITVLPTVPEADLPQLIRAHGADAVRCALVRAQASEGATATFPERCGQEARRLAAFWGSARAILQWTDGRSLSAFAQPIAGSLGELEPEDRALLARFERLRIQCTVDFDRSAPALVHRRLFQFLENDFAAYRDWVAPRLAAEGNPPSKRAALHTLVHTLSNATLLLGPIAPHFAEGVHRALRRGRASLFEETAAGVDRVLLDDTRVKAWDRWVSVVRAVDRFRRQIGVPSTVTLPSVVLVADSDALGAGFRAEASILERLARVQKVEVGSPGAPWQGRRRQLRPREAEIQRVYAAGAAQIIHLLRRMPERKWADPASGQEFSMIVNGQPTRILPSMIAWVETLPERVVPVRWSGGELYAELPAGQALATVPPPPLSPDAFRLVTRIAHRIRSGRAATPPVVIVAAPGALAAELSGVSDAIAGYLGLQEFRVVASDRELPRRDLGFGRTKAGAPWSFHVTGQTHAVRLAKTRPVHPHGARVRPAFAPGDLATTVTDYADETVIARDGAIRALGEELDEILGAPLLGPAKVRGAWDSGLRSVEEFRHAPWDVLVALPGFGVPVATALVTKFGGTVPPRPSPSDRRTALLSGEDGNGGAPAGAPPWVDPATRSSGGPSPPTEVAFPAQTLSIPAAPSELRPAPLRTSAGLAVPAAGVSVDSAPETGRDLPEPESTELPAAPPPPRIAPELPTSAGLLPESVSPEVYEAPVAGQPAGEEMTVPVTAPIPDRSTTDPEIEGLSGYPVTFPESEPAATRPPAPETEEPSRTSASSTAEESSLEPILDPGEPDLRREAPIEFVINPNAAEASSSQPPSPTESHVDDLVIPSPTESAPVSDAPLSPEPLTEAVPETPVADTDSPPSPALPASPAGEPDLANSPELPLPADVPPPELPVEFGPPPPLAQSETSPIPPPRDRRADELAPAPPAESSPPSAPPHPSSNAGEGSDTAEPNVPRPEELGPVPVAESVPSIPPPPSMGHDLSAPIEPESPAPPPEVEIAVVPAPVAPPMGGIELVVGPSYVPTLERFLEATAAGHQGVCVVRDSPERVRAYVGSRPVEIRWLSNIGRGPTLKPNDLEGFLAFLAHSVSTGHVTAFFLEGVEYLVRLHGLDRVVERMLEFDRLAREQSARVWVPMNPKLLSPSELQRFVAAFGAGTPSV